MNTNSSGENSANESMRRFPSDDDLVDYLLGSASASLRANIETWLTGDESHGERLSEFASILLFVADNPNLSRSIDIAKIDSPESVLPTVCAESHELDVAGWIAPRVLDADHDRHAPSPLRFVIGLLALAATISIVIFSLRGFRQDGVTDGRVAIAWAESLTTSVESESNSSTPDWLLEDGLASGAASESTDVVADDQVPDDELNGDELADNESIIGFSSDEPPEWMLAAVADMHSAGTLDNALDAQP